MQCIEECVVHFSLSLSRHIWGELLCVRTHATGKIPSHLLSGFLRWTSKSGHDESVIVDRQTSKQNVISLSFYISPPHTTLSVVLSREEFRNLIRWRREDNNTFDIILFILFFSLLTRCCVDDSVWSTSRKEKIHRNNRERKIEWVRKTHNSKKR